MKYHCFDERVRVRAYYLWLNGSPLGEKGDYYTALNIENANSLCSRISENTDWAFSVYTHNPGNSNSSDIQGSNLSEQTNYLPSHYITGFSEDYDILERHINFINSAEDHRRLEMLNDMWDHYYRVRYTFI